MMLSEKSDRAGLLPILAVVGLAISAIMMWQIIRSPWLLVITVPTVLIGFYVTTYTRKDLRWLYAGFLIIVCVVHGLYQIQLMKTNVDQPNQWDFIGFWLHGKTAVAGNNFYDPQYAQQLSQGMTTFTEDFRVEIVNAGFWYPPPSIFLFLPLGWFDLQPALIVWYVAQSAALIAVMVVLWRWLIPEDDWLSLAFVAALTLMVASTHLTIIYAQTNFLLLLSFVLFLRDMGKPRSGVWLALGILVKPFMAALFLYLLLRRKWTVMISSVITLGIVSLAAVVFFGVETFINYFQGSSVNQLPDFIYTEMTNQSLLATILRVTNYNFTGHSPIFHPLFIVIATLMGLITCWIIWVVDHQYDVLAISINIIFAIIVYPPSQVFYAILLIVPVLWIWVHHMKFRIPLIATIGLITLTYILMAYQSSNVTLGANLLMWFVLVWLGWRVTYKIATPKTDAKLLFNNRQYTKF